MRTSTYRVVDHRGNCVAVNAMTYAAVECGALIPSARDNRQGKMAIFPPRIDWVGLGGLYVARTKGPQQPNFELCLKEQFPEAVQTKNSAFRWWHWHEPCEGMMAVSDSNSPLAPPNDARALRPMYSIIDNSGDCTAVTYLLMEGIKHCGAQAPTSQEVTAFHNTWFPTRELKAGLGRLRVVRVGEEQEAFKRCIGKIFPHAVSAKNAANRLFWRRFGIGVGSLGAAVLGVMLFMKLFGYAQRHQQSKSKGRPRDYGSI